MFRLMCFDPSNFTRRLIARTSARGEWLKVLRHFASILRNDVAHVQVAQSIKSRRSIRLRVVRVVVPKCASRFRVPTGRTASGIHLRATVRGRRFFLIHPLIVASRLFT